MVRSVLVVFFAIVSALLALTSTTASLFTLAAATVLIMGGTGHPLATPPDTPAFVSGYMGSAVTNFVAPASMATPATGVPAGPYTQVAVITPEQFRFDTGLTDLTFNQSVAEGQQSLDGCIRGTAACKYNTAYGTPSTANPIVVFGYSQSATISTLEKAQLIKQDPEGTGTPVSFVLIGNPNRPNGGILARGPEGLTIPIIGVTFSGPTPTDSNGVYHTVDIAQQYDGWADGPENPLDLLADANAIAGIIYLHGNYGAVSLSQPGVVNQGHYGDTTYYLIPAPIIPLLIPLEQLPVVGLPLADTLDPLLQVLVEAGYNRNIGPWVPTQWNLLYFPNPIKLAVDSVVAIPTGLDNGIQDLVGIRPFGTQRPGPYGVGGPPVIYLTQPATATTPGVSSTPKGLVALVDPTTLATDLATFSQLTSVVNGTSGSSSSPPDAVAGQPLPTPTVTDVGAGAGQGLNSGTPVDSPAAAPVPTVGPTVEQSARAGASQTDAVQQEQSISDTKPRRGTDLPVVTKPSQPLIRLPIGSGLSGSKTSGPSGNTSVSKVLGGLVGGSSGAASSSGSADNSLVSHGPRSSHG